MAHAQILQQFHRALAGGAGRHVVDLERDLHVLSRVEERDQIRLLEHKAQMLPAKGAQIHQRPCAVHHEFAADADLARGRRIDQRHRREQRGFARAARTEQRHNFSSRHTQRHVLHGHDLRMAMPIDFRQAGGLDSGG